MGRGESDGDVGFICARNGEGVRRAEIILVRRSWLVAGVAGGWPGGARWGRRRSEATGAGAETVAGRGRAAGRGEMK